MSGDNQQGAGLAALLGKTARTGLGAIRNRAELLSVEWQEEKVRTTEMFLWAAALVFFAVLGMLLLTAFVIFLFREEYRVYAALGFALVYLAGAGVAFSVLKKNLRREPFEASVEELKKDAQWLESLK